MRIEGDTIIFKSTRGNYEHERSGRKPCTLRVIPPEEWDAVCEFGYELATCVHASDAAKKIRIICTEDDNEFFERDLTYLEIFGDVLYNRLVLFCWRHE